MGDEMILDTDEIEVTRLSTRGQLVIPEKLRKKLNLRKGDLFIVEECFGERHEKQILLTLFKRPVAEKCRS